MKAFLLAVLVAVLGAALVGAVGSAVHAQGLSPAPVDLPICNDMGPFDLDGDGDVDHDDTWEWCQNFDRHQQQCQPTMGPDCPAFLDVNGDGQVTDEDIWSIDRFIQYCTRIPWSVVDPGR